MFVGHHSVGNLSFCGLLNVSSCLNTDRTGRSDVFASCLLLLRSRPRLAVACLPPFSKKKKIVSFVVFYSFASNLCHKVHKQPLAATIDIVSTLRVPLRDPMRVFNPLKLSECNCFFSNNCRLST
jgi:hypothetical protein